MSQALKADPARAGWSAFLARIALFQTLPADDLVWLAGAAREQRISRGEVLFRRDDPCSGMMAILAGEVRLSLPGEGRDQVLKWLGPGDVFGELAVLDGEPRTADATAETSGRLLVLERQAVQSLLARNGAFASRVIALLCERLRTTNTMLETMLFEDAATRLGSALLSLSARRPDGRITITQQVLGDLVGTSRETVNKKLREWQATGLISLEPGRITVLRRESLQAALSPVS